MHQFIRTILFVSLIVAATLSLAQEPPAGQPTPPPLTMPPVQDPHAVVEQPGGGTVQKHTVLMANGYRLDPEKDMPYLRTIEGKNGACTGSDIGCGYVLAAAHCDITDGYITMGARGETVVGKVVQAYTPPGWPVPKKNEDWARGANANYDVMLIKVDPVVPADPAAPVPRPAPKNFINWLAQPFVVDPKKKIEAVSAGYGYRDARWNEKKGEYEGIGAGTMLGGVFTLDHSGYFSSAHDFTRGFGKHDRSGVGRICSNPVSAADIAKGKGQSLLPGDSGGPLVGPDGSLIGINSSMADIQAPTKEFPFNYKSCFVDIAGHLPWIYATMKDSCPTLPVIARVDQPEPKKGTPVLPERPRGAVLLPPVLEPPVAPKGGVLPPGVEPQKGVRPPPEPALPPRADGPSLPPIPIPRMDAPPGMFTPVDPKGTPGNPKLIPPSLPPTSPDGPRLPPPPAEPPKQMPPRIAPAPFVPPDPEATHFKRVGEMLDLYTQSAIRARVDMLRSKGLDEKAKGYASLYSTRDPSVLFFDQIHEKDRDFLRGPLAKLVGLDDRYRVVFARDAESRGDAIAVRFGYCPKNRRIEDCTFEERGVVVVTPQAIEIRRSGRPTMTFRRNN